jgi:hypothetical protein
MVRSSATKINGVDETTAWPSYVPTLTCGGGTTAGPVPTGFFKTIGKTTFVRLVLTTTTTTCTGAVLGLPNTSQGGVVLVGRESAANGAMFVCGTRQRGHLRNLGDSRIRFRCDQQCGLYLHGRLRFAVSNLPIWLNAAA